MDLQQWQRSDEQIVARADKVNVEQLVISDDAVDSLVIDHCVSRSELHDDFFIAIARKNASVFANTENIPCINEELIGRV